MSRFFNISPSLHTQPLLFICPTTIVYPDNAFNTTPVIASTFSSSNLRATSCKLIGSPCIRSGSSTPISVSIKARTKK